MAEETVAVEAAPEVSGGFEFELPGGLKTNAGILKRVVMVEMTGEDEENIAHPSVATNGGRIITTLLARTVKLLGDKPPTQDMIRNLLIGDRDFLMVKLRQITIGNDYTVKVSCPKCAEKVEVKINLDDLEVKKLESETYEFPFELHKGYLEGSTIHKKGAMKLPTGVEQEFLAASQNKGAATTALLTRCCVKLGTLKAITPNIIRGLSFNDRNTMGRLLTEKMPGLVLEASHSCPACQNQWTEPLQVADFFVMK
jgi:hypothetical protein